MSRRIATRLLGLVFAGSMTLSVAPAALADGEIGDVGDTNSIGNIYDGSNNHATLNVDYVHDCPAGVSGCDIQVQFSYQCPEIWCTDWVVQPWKSVGAPVGGVGKVSADCTGSGNDENRWQAAYKIRWWATGTVTVTLTGEEEQWITLTGGVSYKNIAEAAATAGHSGMTRGNVVISTVTATSQSWSVDKIATSQGIYLRTCE